jgi:hypothetical protein
MFRGKHAKGLARFGLPKGAIYVYIDDLYHTLLNMPRARFLFSFFGVYLTLVSGQHMLSCISCLAAV